MRLFKLTFLCFFLYNFSLVYAQQNPAEILTTLNRMTASSVLLNNGNSAIPLKNLEELKIGSFFASPALHRMLNKYEVVPNLTPSAFSNDKDLKRVNTLVVEVNDTLLTNPHFIERLDQLSKTKQLIIAGFGSYACLAQLNNLKSPIIWNRDTSDYAKVIVAQIVFGGVAAEGKLPVSVSSNFDEGAGYTTVKTRLEYSIPEAVGIDGAKITAEIDAVAKEMIEGRAAPGAVVMIVKDNHVIFEKAYGNHYYDVEQPVNTDDIFDLASISKIAATTLAVMKLDEDEKIDLNKTIGTYLKDARNTNKANIKVRDVMLHQAGFVSFIPFYRDLSSEDFRTDSSAAYPVKVAENYYLKKGYFENVMWPLMLQSKVKPPGAYLYSDLSMYVMQKIVEAQSKKPLDEFVKQVFYDKLGMYSTGFNPRERFPAARIVPTELDKTFRKSQLIGYVHDQGAAMAGGVAGHAGLFSTANDLAIYGQLLLNKGVYGGEAYLKPETVDKYTRRYSANSRRGLGFDRQDPDPAKEYPSKSAPPSVFGHTGYTGTAIWMDPDHQLIYIFLSNRVQPFVSPYLSKLDIRSRIHDAIYKAIPKK